MLSEGAQIASARERDITPLLTREQIAAERDYILHCITDMLRSQNKNTDTAQLAQDLTHDVIAKALKNMSSFRGDSELRTWLFSIALNAVRSRHKKQSTKRELLSTKTDDTGSGEEPVANTTDTAEGDTNEVENINRAELRATLHRLVTKLPTGYQKAIRLFYGLDDGIDRSQEEVAAILGIAVGTVKSQLFKGMVKLREIAYEEDVDLKDYL